MAEFRDLTPEEEDALGTGYVDAITVSRCLCGAEVDATIVLHDAQFWRIDYETGGRCPVCGRVYRVAIQVNEEAV